MGVNLKKTKLILIAIILINLIYSLEPFLEYKLDKNYSPNKLGESIIIDGILNEPDWEKADVIDDFTQAEPYHNVAPSKETNVKVLYNNIGIDTFTYIMFFI